MNPRLPSLRAAIRLAFLLLGALPPILRAATPVPSPFPPARATAWKAVDDAIAQGQPRTALERLQPILDAALRDQAWAEATRAIGRRIQLETQIEGGEPGERVTRFAAALANAPEPLKPVLHALTAHAWWAYFQQNRWRIQQRTATASATDATSTDFRTWDLPRLFSEIDAEFSRALTNTPTLQRTPIATLDGLLLPGTVPDRQRPTLFDFLAHEAIAFLASGEQAAAQPEDAFVLEASSPVLGTPDAFLAWTPPTTDPAAPTRKAILLFQQLLRFHQDDPEPSAFLDADLARIRFAANLATGPDLAERHLAALQSFVSRAGRHDLAAQARHDGAQRLVALGRLEEAHAVATETTRAFPGSAGAKLCANLIASLESKVLLLATERVWSAPYPPLSVTHRGLTNVWFRAVRADWEQFLERRQPRPENLTPRQRLDLLRRPATREWSVTLPITNAWTQLQTRFDPPQGLPPGFYFLFASARPDFAEEDNVLHATEIWVSELALLLRPRPGNLEGFVLEAQSGEPVPAASVEAWYLGSNGERIPIPRQTTDALGIFQLPNAPQNRPVLVRARRGEDQVATPHDFGSYGDFGRPQANRRTLFFTDRALYRPGQLIQYKGLCFRYEAEATSYDLLQGQRVTVVLRDLNGRELARGLHEANDYGSFSGSFTAPPGTQTGPLVLEVEGDPPGSTQVTVEEYKRPRFQVTLDAPAEAARLGAPARVLGRATGYTGAPVDNATVTWRVTRRVQLPPWCAWFRIGPILPHRGNAQAIAHGTARTQADGSFEIRFPASPDPAVPESNEPVFHFEVHADVTDAAGETRSAEREVPVGYAALTATLEASEWQVPTQPVRLTLATRSLEGSPQPARGVLRIHRVRQPERVPRSATGGDHGPQGPQPRFAGLDANESDPNHWPLGDSLTQQAVQIGASGNLVLPFQLGAGLYRATLEIQDASGRTVTARLPLRVLEPQAPRLDLKIAQLVAAPTWEVLPGEEFTALWGTGYETGRALVEIEHRHRIVERFWTDRGRTQQTLRHRVTPEYRGGFTLHVTQVQQNQAHLTSRTIEVPWRDRELDVRWETFRSVLEPGAKETWTAVITPRIPGRTPGPAELVATLYDASLDQFLPHTWPTGFDCWPRHHSILRTVFQNGDLAFRPFRGSWRPRLETVDLRYRSFPPDLVRPAFSRRGYFPGQPAPAMLEASPMAVAMSIDAAGGPLADTTAGMPRAAVAFKGAAAGAEIAAGATGGGTEEAETASNPARPPAEVSPRRNLQETAFFLPHTLTDSNGVARLTFTLPEALTEWRFLGFAHDQALRSGSLTGRTVTRRDLMVQPNAPRFLREGDELEFPVKVSNTSSNPISGRARLEFRFTHDDSAADTALGNRQLEQSFSVPPAASQTLSWRIVVPDGCGFLRFKATASSDRSADGEEGWLPVLPRRILVTESFPVSARGPATREFRFQALAEAGKSSSLRHESLTVEVVSQPAWYAVLALPYLMEYPHACTEQVFNRYYANSLAHHLANRDPKIRRVFDLWKATPALLSPLEKNPELKSIALEETPWLREARTESASRQHLGMLFEQDRVEAELQRALRDLAERQRPEGGWSWFPGGPLDEYITLYVVAGFGRLQHLGLQPDLTPALRALESLDAAATRRYDRLREAKELERTNLDPFIALHLYARSLYSVPVAEGHQAALSYWLDQARQHWLKMPRQSQAHLALAFTRFGNRIPAEFQDHARAIVRSLKEHSVVDPELGRFWRDQEFSSSWHRAPIETQALMIEAFAKVTGDTQAVEECQVWLLRQKQTQAWKSTRATAEAIYSLLAQGPNLLASDALATLELGNRSFRPTAPSAVEPGTGFYQIRVPAADIEARLAAITFRKPDPGLAWGAVHWQYFEDASRVKPFDATPLRITKRLFTRSNTRTGRVLSPVQGPLQVGDELVIRVEIRTDRDLEYVHLKDQRPSGTEPVNVLSGYRFQDGLGYYESTRDTASHFFIGYMSKGTYVFEYPVRIQHRGRYPTGLATVQCLYAPEFNSHSASTLLEVL